MDNGLSVEDFCELIGRDTVGVEEVRGGFDGAVLEWFEKVLAVVRENQRVRYHRELIRVGSSGEGTSRQIDLYVWDGRSRYSRSVERLTSGLKSAGLDVREIVTSFWPENRHLVCADHLMFRSKADYDLVLMRVAPNLGFS